MNAMTMITVLNLKLLIVGTTRWRKLEQFLYIGLFFHKKYNYKFSRLPASSSVIVAGARDSHIVLVIKPSSNNVI